MSGRRVVLGLLLVIGLAVANSGCVTPEPPTITPESAKVTSVTAAGFTVQLTLKVFNPNGFALKGRSVRATITFDGSTKLGPVDIDKKVELPANKTVKMTVDVAASWAHGAQIATLALGKQKIPYVVDGTMVVGGKSLNAKVPFEIKGEVSRAELVETGLKGLPALPGLPNLGR